MGKRRQAVEIRVTSRSEIPHVNPPDGAALISVTSPELEHPQVSEKWRAVLRLKFHDIERRWSDDDMLFTEKQAEEILGFVKEIKPSILWVHCDAGISRSAGIAVALDKLVNGVDSGSLYPFYNRHVVETMIKTIGQLGRNVKK